MKPRVFLDVARAKTQLPQVPIEALPSAWTGKLLMVDHMGGFVSGKSGIKVPRLAENMGEDAGMFMLTRRSQRAACPWLVHPESIA